MAKVVPFTPHHQLRRAVVNLYNQMVSGKLTRQQLTTILVDMMDCMGLKRLDLGNFVLLRDSCGDRDFVWTKGKVSYTGACPVCESREAHYLAGVKMVGLMCPKCGCIFDVPRRLVKQIRLIK
jgi:hypothetical protein